MVDVVLPHGVALRRQFRTRPAVDIGRVVAVVAAAVPLTIPGVFDILLPV